MEHQSHVWNHQPAKVYGITGITMSSFAETKGPRGFPTWATGGITGGYVREIPELDPFGK